MLEPKIAALIATAPEGLEATFESSVYSLTVMSGGEIALVADVKIGTTDATGSIDYMDKSHSFSFVFLIG